jgi:hypothetical protein
MGLPLEAQVERKKKKDEGEKNGGSKYLMHAKGILWLGPSD